MFYKEIRKIILNILLCVIFYINIDQIRNNKKAIIKESLKTQVNDACVWCYVLSSERVVGGDDSFSWQRTRSAGNFCFASLHFHRIARRLEKLQRRRSEPCRLQTKARSTWHVTAHLLMSRTILTTSPPLLNTSKSLKVFSFYALSPNNLRGSYQRDTKQM